MPPPDLYDFDRLRRTLYTAVIADVLDALGMREQVPAVSLRCVSGHDVLVGRAKTTQWEEIDDVDPRPYELELRAVDECQPGDVIVCRRRRQRALGRVGRAAVHGRAPPRLLGALVDGAVRDVAKMHHLGFTVFARGTCPRDSLHRQRVTAIDVPVEIGGVRIAPGDLLFADADGMVVVPHAVAGDVLDKAWEKVTAENRVRDEIRAGMKATDVFRKYGVL